MKEHTNSRIIEALNRAPIDDEPESVEEKRAVDAARLWLKQNGGQGIPHAEAMRLLGLDPADEGVDSLRSALLACPIEDDEITAETAAALDRASESLARGEGIAHEEILREFKFDEGPDRPY